MKILLSLILFFTFINSVTAKDFAELKLGRKYKNALVLGCEDIKIKTPLTGAILGLLPGGGSFYTERVGLGVADLLLWPFSPLWDSPLAWHKAKKLNMEETVFRCELQGNDL